MPEFLASPPAWSREFVGIPYRERDCYGLGQLAWQKRRGVALPDYDYPRTARLDAWSEGVREQVAEVVDRALVAGCWDKVEGEPDELDFALYLAMGGRTHIVTVLGGGWGLNTNLGMGSHCARLRDFPNQGYRLDGFYRPA